MRLDNLQGAPRSTSPIDLPIPDATAAPAGNGSPAAPATGTAVALERRLADLLASVVKKDDVPVDANFFYDLGADSLLMAQFCARVRKQPDLPAVSIKDIYQNPTISALAAALAPAEVASVTVQIQVQDRLAEVLSGVLDIEHVPVEADFFQDLGADSLVMAQFCARVRKQPDLPAVSIKDIYQNPTISALAAALAPAEEASATVQVQERLAEVLADVLGMQQVPMDADFFQDLGADSLVMAKFCARVRKQPDLPTVSMKDVYGNPSVSALAAALQVPPQQDRLQEPSPAVASVPETPAPMDARTWEYVICGALQVLVYLGYCVIAGLLTVNWYQWVYPEAGPGQGTDFWEIYLRSTAYAAAVFVLMCILPVAAKWIILGRFRPGEIRLWSLAYFRFWLVKTLMRTSPLLLLTGSPLTTFYLRAMGAKVGRNVMIMTNRLPICTDLLTIGEGTVIRKDVVFNGYRAHGGVIQVGGVTLGRDVIVGEGSVLDIDTSMGDGSQLGHRSTLYTGQVRARRRAVARVAGQTHGGADYAAESRPTPYRPWRRGWFAISQLLSTIGLWPYLLAGCDRVGRPGEPQRRGTSGDAGAARSPTGSSTPTPSPMPLLLSSVARSSALLLVTTVPRAAPTRASSRTRCIRCSGCGMRRQRAVARMTNSPMLTGSCSATARTSCTTCGPSGTSSRRSSRPARISARGSSTTTRSFRPSAAAR